MMMMMMAVVVVMIFIDFSLSFLPFDQTPGCDTVLAPLPIIHNIYLSQIFVFNFA